MSEVIQSGVINDSEDEDQHSDHGQDEQVGENGEPFGHDGQENAVAACCSSCGKKFSDCWGAVKQAWLECWQCMPGYNDPRFYGNPICEIFRSIAECRCTQIGFCVKMFLTCAWVGWITFLLTHAHGLNEMIGPDGADLYPNLLVCGNLMSPTLYWSKNPEDWADYTTEATCLEEGGAWDAGTSKCGPDLEWAGPEGLDCIRTNDTRSDASKFFSWGVTTADFEEMENQKDLQANQLSWRLTTVWFVSVIKILFMTTKIWYPNQMNIKAWGVTGIRLAFFIVIVNVLAGLAIQIKVPHKFRLTDEPLRAEALTYYFGYPMTAFAVSISLSFVWATIFGKSSADWKKKHRDDMIHWERFENYCRRAAINAEMNDISDSELFNKIDKEIERKESDLAASDNESENDPNREISDRMSAIEELDDDEEDSQRDAENHIQFQRRQREKKIRRFKRFYIGRCVGPNGRTVQFDRLPFKALKGGEQMTQCRAAYAFMRGHKAKEKFESLYTNKQAQNRIIPGYAPIFSKPEAGHKVNQYMMAAAWKESRGFCQCSAEREVWDDSKPCFLSVDCATLPAESSRYCRSLLTFFALVVFVLWIFVPMLNWSANFVAASNIDWGTNVLVVINSFVNTFFLGVLGNKTHSDMGISSQVIKVVKLLWFGLVTIVLPFEMWAGFNCPNGYNNILDYIRGTGDKDWSLCSEDMSRFYVGNCNEWAMPMILWLPQEIFDNEIGGTEDNIKAKEEEIIWDPAKEALNCSDSYTDTQDIVTWWGYGDNETAPNWIFWTRFWFFVFVHATLLYFEILSAPGLTLFVFAQCHFYFCLLICPFKCCEPKVAQKLLVAIPGPNADDERVPIKHREEAYKYLLKQGAVREIPRGRDGKFEVEGIDSIKRLEDTERLGEKGVIYEVSSPYFRDISDLRKFLRASNGVGINPNIYVGTNDIDKEPCCVSCMNSIFTCCDSEITQQERDDGNHQEHEITFFRFSCWQECCGPCPCRPRKPDPEKFKTSVIFGDDESKAKYSCCNCKKRGCDLLQNRSQAYDATWRKQRRSFSLSAILLLLSWFSDAMFFGDNSTSFQVVKGNEGTALTPKVYSVNLGIHMQFFYIAPYLVCCILIGVWGCTLRWASKTRECCNPEDAISDDEQELEAVSPVKHRGSVLTESGGSLSLDGDDDLGRGSIDSTTRNKRRGRKDRPFAADNRLSVFILKFTCCCLWREVEKAGPCIRRICCCCGLKASRSAEYNEEEDKQRINKMAQYKARHEIDQYKAKRHMTTSMAYQMMLGSHTWASVCYRRVQRGGPDRVLLDQCCCCCKTEQEYMLGRKGEKDFELEPTWCGTCSTGGFCPKKQTPDDPCGGSYLGACLCCCCYDDQHKPDCCGNPCPNGSFPASCYKENTTSLYRNEENFDEHSDEEVNPRERQEQDRDKYRFHMTWASAFCGWCQRLLRFSCCMINIGVRYTAIFYLGFVFFLLVCFMTQSWGYFMTTLAWKGLKHNAFFLMDTVVTAILGLVSGIGLQNVQNIKAVELDRKIAAFQKKQQQRTRMKHRASAIYRPLARRSVEMLVEYRDRLNLQQPRRRMPNNISSGISGMSSNLPRMSGHRFQADSGQVSSGFGQSGFVSGRISRVSNI